MSRNRKRRKKPGITIREAVDTDAYQIYDMSRKYHEERPGKCHEGFDDQTIFRLIAKIILDPAHTALMAFNGGPEPIGVLGLLSIPSHVDPSVVMVRNVAFWVEPEHRNKGVEGKLLESAVEWSKQQKRHALVMTTPRDNQEEARKLVESGFKLAESSYIRRL